MIVLLNWSSEKIEEMVSVDGIIVRTAAVVMMHAIKLNSHFAIPRAPVCAPFLVCGLIS